MQTKEKMYTLALMTLVLMGISAAWAAYNDTATLSGDIEDFASVSGQSLTLSKLKRKAWFNETVSGVFSITGIEVDAVYVRVLLANAPELVDDFKSLIIKVVLKDNDQNIVDSGYISLEGGAAEVLLEASGLSSGSSLTVDAIVYGRPSKNIQDVSLQLVCLVEQAGAVTTSQP